MLIAAFGHKTSKLSPVSPFLLANPILMWISLASIFWCCELIRRQLEQDVPSNMQFRRWMRIVGLAALAIAVAEIAPIVAIGMIWLFSPHPFVTTQEAAVVCLVWAGLMLTILPIQARDWIVAARRYERWESLEVGDLAE
jgi:hypothetical protein